MISGHTDRSSFAQRLHELVSPAQPIQSVERLFGRAKELDSIEKALYAPGRHVFIYGDRGVGKSSLAAAAANQCQSSDAEYIDASCSKDSTLRSIVANIAYQALNASRLHRDKTTGQVSAESPVLKAGRAVERTPQDLQSEIRTVPDAVEVLRQAVAKHSRRPVVVLDEFDRMAEDKERRAFADLLKELGDKKVDVKFIITGVGGSINELLVAHESAYRQLETIELGRLDYTARMQIVESVLDPFGLHIDRDVNYRIAQVSDGFPYYVHLITEKLMWRLFEDQAVVTEAVWGHFDLAIRDAIQGINAELRRQYERAVTQRSDDYEPVLWATADGDILSRFLQDLYRSYEAVMDQLQDLPRLDYKKFSARIRALKESGAGEILKADYKPGLYTYREKMLRGYVRMQAEANHVLLRGESGQEAPKQVVRAPSARTGYGPSVPRGIRFTGEKKD